MNNPKNQNPKPKPKTGPRRLNLLGHAHGIAGNMLRIAQAASERPGPCQDMGNLLRASRKACGVSQQFVADQLQVSVRSVKRWEKGVCMPRYLQQQRLFRVLEIPLQTVLGFRAAAARVPKGLDRFTDGQV